MAELQDREELEDILRRKILRVMQAQADDIARKVGDPPSISGVSDSDWNQMADELQAAIQPPLESIFMASAEQTAGELPNRVRVDWQLANKPAAEWARQYSFQLVKGINDTSRDRLQTYVGNFFERRGTTIEDLRAQITTVFDDNRAALIATTEVTRAAVEGQKELVNLAEKQNPNVALIPIWETNLDEFVCPICRPLNGKRLTGELEGTEPPAHPRCRCGVRYEARRKA